MRLVDGESLLQKAFVRAATLGNVTEILTVTNRDLYFKTEDEYRTVNSRNLPTSFILEPFGRNTAPAIAMAAVQVAEVHDADAVLLVLPADHLITKETEFAQAVSRATQLAQQGYLVTFGIQPSSPETGYGYIEADHAIPLSTGDSEGPSSYTVKRFVEKPSFEKAEEYIASGRYLWNSGMFCFCVGAVLKELGRHAPELLNAARVCLDESRNAEGVHFSQTNLESETFRQVPDISIDYALMERSDKVAVVACDIGWSDIGSWSAISEMRSSDSDGNRVVGDVQLHNVKNCYIQSQERVVAALGIENLIVIDTPDALLVADKSSVQDVKQIVSKLKLNGNDAYKLHREVHRPWGTYTILEEGSCFKIKRIVVKPGASLSLQMHYHRSEHWIVVSGTAKVINGELDVILGTNESTYIRAGQKHRLENPGVLDLVLIEVQSGDYLGEDDIVRFQDNYGRC
jgi:mannose-1-phosphate guanylyltransferase